MDFFTTTSAASSRASACLIVGIYESGKLGRGAAEVDSASGGELKRRLRRGDLTGKLGEARVLTGLAGVRAERVIIAGLGEPAGFGVERFCRAVEAAMKAVRGVKLADLVNYLTLEDTQGATAYYLARHTVERVAGSYYAFTELKSRRDRLPAPVAKVGVALRDASDRARAAAGARHGSAIANAMSLARDLGNLPANVCTPTYLARAAQRTARTRTNLQVRVLDEAGMKRLNMNALLSVTHGTAEPAKLIVMEYKGARRERPVVLVGKGITFDTGGISLKPGPGMDEMKFDMCGAASVIATVSAIAELELPINVTAVVPCCENLPGGTATRPGDIVTSMSGQTIEILNTDAEGRLILCDALTYAKRFRPELMIDVATLTGACVIALGHHLSAIMSNDDELAQALGDAGIAANDRGWRLPLGEEYDRQLESNFADFANVGGREGGAITAACFLAKFIGEVPWAHLDIAGTAWRSGAEKGATGRPVPLLTEFLLKRSGALP